MVDVVNNFSLDVVPNCLYFLKSESFRSLSFVSTHQFIQNIFYVLGSLLCFSKIISENTHDILNPSG
jgi:hypothetical protein